MFPSWFSKLRNSFGLTLQINFITYIFWNTENEKTLTGKRRFLMPTKASSAEKRKGRCEPNCQGQRYPVSATLGGNVVPIRNKAAVVMGLNSSSISLEENNNSARKKGANGNEMTSYLAVYSSDVPLEQGSNGNRGNSTCPSIVTLDASQLVAAAMARVEKDDSQFDRQLGEQNGKLIETPSGHSEKGDLGHHNSASGLVGKETETTKTSSAGRDYCQQRPCSSNLPSPRNSIPGRPPSVPSTATSSPVGNVKRLHQTQLVTLESYNTTSSPASQSTSSNYQAYTQNALKLKTIKESNESKRERKAAKILAIITGKTPQILVPLFLKMLNWCLYFVLNWKFNLNSNPKSWPTQL